MRLEVRQADTLKRDTILLVGGGSNSFDNFQRRNARFPTNSTADRPAEDGGEEEFQHLG
jgi:hypothetical protein